MVGVLVARLVARKNLPPTPSWKEGEQEKTRVGEAGVPGRGEAPRFEDSSWAWRKTCFGEAGHQEAGHLESGGGKRRTFPQPLPRRKGSEEETLACASGSSRRRGLLRHPDNFGGTGGWVGRMCGRCGLGEWCGWKR